MYEKVKQFRAPTVALLALFAAMQAKAGGGGGLDYSVLTDAINFDEVGPAVLAAAGAVVALHVIIKGVQLIVGFVEGRAILNQSSRDELEMMDERSRRD